MKPLGNKSLAVTSVAALGPAFVKVTVKNTLLPMFGALLLTVLLKLRSARGLGAGVSAAKSSPAPSFGALSASG